MARKPTYTIWEAIQAAIGIATRALEEVRDMQQRPGPRGADGFGFKDMDVQFDGERTITLKFERDDEVKEFTFKMPCMIYRGVYTQSQKYEVGDSVTFGGSLWVCKRDTTDKPNEGNAWQLAAKKGRDSK